MPLTTSPIEYYDIQPEQEITISPSVNQDRAFSSLNQSYTVQNLDTPNPCVPCIATSNVPSYNVSSVPATQASISIRERTFSQNALVQPSFTSQIHNNMAQNNNFTQDLVVQPTYQTQIQNNISQNNPSFPSLNQSSNSQPSSVISTNTNIAVKSDCKFLPPLSLDQYKINEDPNPEIIKKKPLEKVHYTQEVAIRLLEPPALPRPGDIIVKQLPNIQIAPAPPLVIREAPPRPPTPPPLVIREAPPNPPSQVSEKLVLVPGKVIPPPTRRVIVEKLPPIPQKPQQIMIEKWLPFKQQKRRVVYEKAEPDCILPNPKNLIIHWEKPEVEVSREFKTLGTQTVCPLEYAKRFGNEILPHEKFRNTTAEIQLPENVINSNAHKQFELPELEGDIAALSLVDLDKAGLGEYKQYLSNLGITRNNSAFTSSGYGLITTTDCSNLISAEHAQNIANNINNGSENVLNEGDLRVYFNNIDRNRDGLISFEEFKSAVL